jgi:hypothetical protein
MGTKCRLVAIATGLAFAVCLGGGVLASPKASSDIAEKPKVGVELKEQLEAQRVPAECHNVPSTPGPMPAWFAQRCVTARAGAPELALQPTASRGPILLQEVSTDTVRQSSVAGIATLTSFGTLVPASATDFPADMIRLPGDPQRVYQITSAGAVSRYTTGGVNTVLTPIPAAAGSTWSDTATDPTSGNVYGSAIVGSCVSSTLSRIDVVAGTRVDIGAITSGGCIIAIAADNAGNLFGIDIVGDNLISINKVTGAGTVVGSIGFNANFGQAMDCDPASGVCYMFTINVTAGNTADLRSVNTVTGATTLVGTYGSTSPGGAVQVGGAVFETITDTCTVDADCQDGNLCNGVETCVATVCTPGTPVVCSDGLFCTSDVCAPATGVCSYPANPCSDGDTCTVDSCDEANGVCNHATPAPLVFCNTGSISIPSSGAGTPYPSPITVSGLGTSASLCSVQLLGMNHTWADDIDILLVGPVAPTENATIMSDVGGSSDLVGTNLTLKDSAPTSMPDASVIASGTYKPTNIGATADPFPAPAPTANVSSSLAAFAGNPNGTWQLYVVDDTGGDSGTISGGWCVSIVPTGCSTSVDCNDGNPCTDDACTNSLCVFTNNTAACTDGNACTLNDLCSGGVCVGGAPQACDDGDACTANNCNTGTGQCQFPAIVCDDSNTCTDDSCSPATGCVFTPNNANVCSDGNLCTTPDVCQNGTCVGQNPVVCTPDANLCTTEECNPATGACVSNNNTNACDDGNVCTTGDVCGPALSENFDGEVAPNLPAGWSSTADGDGLPWETDGTAGDSLPNSAFGVDVPGPLVANEYLVSPPISITTASAKLTFRNRWSFESATTCYDAGVLEIDIAGGGFTDIVTAGGSFVSGGYTGTVSTGFSNPLAGRSAWCNASAGYPAYLTTVVNLPAAAAGQTVQLQWRIGSDTSAAAIGQDIDSIVVIDGTNNCNPGTLTDCNDNNPCTDDFCDPSLGCQHSNNTDNCDDGNACTILDKCNGGACGGTAVVCDDSNPCTLDSCDTGSGCVFTPITAPGEVQSVTASSDKVTYNWAATASATQYDVVRGDVSALPVGPGGGDEVCLGSVASPTVSDGSVPPLGTAYWYLPRAGNTCGKGTYGNQGVNGAPGAPRVTTTCP